MSAAASRCASPSPGRGSRSPHRAGDGVPSVTWEMRCPLRGYIVAGIDARVSDRADRRLDPRRERRTGLAGGHHRARGAVHGGLHGRRASRRPSGRSSGAFPTSGGGGRGRDLRPVHDRLRSGQAARPPRASSAVSSRARRCARPAVARPGRACSARSSAFAFRHRGAAGHDPPERRARPPHDRGAGR